MNNSENENNNQVPKDGEQIEILDLDSHLEETTEESLTSKKENYIIIVIVIIVALVAIFVVPRLYSMLNGKNQYIYSNTSKDINDAHSIEGYLEIGKDEGYITAKRIQFYSFMKKDNNVLSFKVMAETGVNDIPSYNIYVELFNSKKNVIYRTKFDQYESLDRKTIERVNITLNENLYGEATYAKIVILEESNFALLDNNLNCTYSEVNDYYTINGNVVYNFSTNGLVGYKVTKRMIVNPDYNGTLPTDPSKMFSKEGESLSALGLAALEYTDEDITYTVDLKKDVIEGDSYKLGTTYRQIKLEREKDKWRCE